MAQVTFKGEPVAISGTMPAIGTKAPAFTLTADDLSEVTLDSLKGKNVILNIFPSMDTPVCAIGVRKFNEKASALNNTQILCVSADLPFASARFCGAEGIHHVSHGSTFRHPEFAKSYGVAIADGPLRGLLARAIVCINEQGQVLYNEMVSEITSEPDYERAIQAIS